MPVSCTFTATQLTFTIPKITYCFDRLTLQDKLITCYISNDATNNYDDNHHPNEEVGSCHY